MRASWRCTTCWARWRRAGRRATILLAHAGGACDAGACTGEIVRLAEELGGRGVSLIVAGHTHQVMTTRVAGIPILEAGAGEQRWASRIW